MNKDYIIKIKRVETNDIQYVADYAGGDRLLYTINQSYAKKYSNSEANSVISELQSMSVRLGERVVYTPVKL